MLIYRFENEDGLGPYAQDEFYLSFVQRHNNNTERFPTGPFDKTFPKDMPSITEIKDVHYGFKSLEQLHKWFRYEDISDMYDSQIFCYAYEINDDDPNLFISDKQVLFRKSDKKTFLDESELLTKEFIRKRDRDRKYYYGN